MSAIKYFEVFRPLKSPLSKWVVGASIHPRAELAHRLFQHEPVPHVGVAFLSIKTTICVQMINVTMAEVAKVPTFST